MTAVLKRELRSYFTSPIAYVFIGILCALYGFQYWIVMLNGSSYYITSYVYQNMFMWSLMLLPIITMRSMCEDRKNKTDQALLTAPVSVTGIVWGKYLACLTVYLIAMLLCLVPALVIGAGLSAILYVSGGTENPLNYVVLVCSVTAMSVFFSIHYLIVYYLLQPYTAGTEMKSGTYRIVMALTYVGCYALMNLRLPILVFGVACIAFCVLYSVVASVLIYKYAPRTFRLRT